MDPQDVVEVLRRNNKKMMESALLEALNTRGRVTSAKELREALIVLEVRGLVRVHSLDEERRLIILLE
jgi:repressor of nif and glnA expression